MTRYTLDQIRDFWTSQALSHGQSPAASWSDEPVIELEIQALGQRLAAGDRVLDLGCANGYSTVQLAGQVPISIRGLDYIPEMIAQAQARLAQLPAELAQRLEFAVGNILDLSAEPSGAYDKVVIVRVIINLSAWAHQQRGLLEACRVLKPGGLLLLSEATLQGWRRLNAFRNEWGLADIPMPGFNTYLDEHQVQAALEPVADLVEVVNFASTYFVGTRILKPLLDQALQAGVKVADPTMEWNRWFAQLPAWGDYGTQKLMIFRRRA